MFTGLFTALITPFRDGIIDEAAVEKIIEMQVAAGVAGVVPCGTTGESPTLTHEEHNQMIELVIRLVRGRIKVIAGTGSNSTAEAIAMTRHAADAGADGALLVAPYYNKPCPEGIYQHYKAVNDAVNIPVIIYNIPGRSVINITDDMIARLALLPNIKGVKDATGDLSRVASLRLKLPCNDFAILTGEDATALGFNAMGGHGSISVTANIAPELVNKLQNLSFTGKWKEALKVQDQLTELHSAMFAETNPIPIKYAASLLGLCSDEIRLPLTRPSASLQHVIRQQLIRVGLLE